MARRNDVFPSKFLVAGDLNGKSIALKILRAPIETLKNKNGEDTKTVLYFKGAKKSLPLNRTNWDSVADITGEDDSDNWAGHQIELYPTTTQFGSDVVDCIRIRAPAQAELKPARGKPTKAAKPAAADETDFDDEIPFK